LGAKDRWIARSTERYGDALVEDKGGPDEVTAAMRHTIEVASVARGCAMLILSEVKRSGFIRKVDGSWDLAPGARELAKFLKLELQALQALGFERREPRAISLEDITADYSTSTENRRHQRQLVPVIAAKVMRRTTRSTEAPTPDDNDD
jgi:hypothetical protein